MDDDDFDAIDPEDDDDLDYNLEEDFLDVELDDDDSTGSEIEDDLDDSASVAHKPGPADGLVPPWKAGESLWGFVSWNDPDDE